MITLWQLVKNGFVWLIGWLPGLASEITKGFNAVLWALQRMPMGGAVATILGLVGFAFFYIGLINAGIQSVLAKVGTLTVTGGTSSAMPQTFADLLAFANYALPVQESIVWIVILFTLNSAGVAYRFVKSLVPTLA